jgi:mannosyltransferase OCH1-like enzyme
MMVHAFWFGGNDMPQEIVKCIDSWKQYLPNLEIKIWNEALYTSDSKFYLEAIKNKQWAFASDYARFDILNKYGGLYLDTDMLILKSMEPLFSRCKYFIGRENDEELGCSIICLPKDNQISKHVLKELERIELKDYSTIPKLISKIYFNNSEIFECVEILHKDVFYSYPFNDEGCYEDYIKEISYGVHLWNASWKNYFEKALLKKKKNDHYGAIFEIVKAARFKPWRLIHILRLVWK